MEQSADGLPAEQLDRLLAVLRAEGAKFAYVFGSSVAGNAGPTSDIDVAAHFGGRAPDSWQVDVPGVVDLVVLDAAPLYLAGRVATRGRLVLDDDPAARVAWEADTRTVYLDELPYIEEMTQAYLRAVAHHG